MKRAEHAHQKHVINLPLARQFALTAVKLPHFKGLAAKHVMPGTLLEHVFFVSCSRLDATEGSNRLPRLAGVSWNWGSYCWFTFVLSCGC